LELLSGRSAIVADSEGRSENDCVADAFFIVGGKGEKKEQGDKSSE
jgi:hypothetical protein